MYKWRKVLPLFAIFLLLLNMMFPLTAAAQSWTMKQWDPPKWEKDSWETDDWEVDQWEMDAWEVDRWEREVNELNEWKADEWKIQQRANPERWTAKPWVVREWEMKVRENAPSQKPGNPGTTNPDGTPDSTPSDPSDNGPDAAPGDTGGGSDSSGGNDIGGSSESDGEAGSSDGSPAEGSSQTNSKPATTYDYMKYITKDVVGKTVNFADKMASSNSLDQLSPDDVKSFKNFGKDILYSSTKIVTKGNEWADGAFAVTDTVKAGKSLYDEMKNFNLVSKARALEQAGDISGALNTASQIKTFSKANAVVSTALLPFSVYDTVNNVKKIQSTSGQEKTDAIMSTVGSVGDTLTGLAAPVALLPIPGAQAVAAGLLVVGTAASLISAAYKLYRNPKVRELASAAWKGTKKAASAVKNFAKDTVNSVKDAGKKVFKKLGSIFG